MIAPRVGMIGIELSQRSVRLAQLRFDAGRASLHAVAEFRRLGPDSSLADEAARIAGVLRRTGFVGVRLAVCLAPNQVLASEMELPPIASGAPVEMLAAAELGRAYKQDPASLEVAVWQIPVPARQAGATTCMAAACSHETSNTIAAAFEGVGLDVRRVEPREIALARACLPRLAVGHAITLILSLRHRGSRLLAVQNHTIVLDRALEVGDLHPVYQQAAEAAGVDPPDATDVLASVLSPDDPLGVPDAVRLAVRTALQRFGAGLVEEVHTACGYVGRRFGGREVARMLVTSDGPEAGPVADLLGGATSLETIACTVADVAVVPPVLADIAGRGGFLAAVGVGYARRKGDRC